MSAYLLRRQVMRIYAIRQGLPLRMGIKGKGHKLAEVKAKESGRNRVVGKAGIMNREEF